MDLIVGTGIAALLLLAVLHYVNHGFGGVDDDAPKPKKRRGPDMAFSAGRDAAQQNLRLRQIFIPMTPDEEPEMRVFYLDTLGLTEMRSPNFAKEPDGFWAISGTRQIYFGSRPPFPYDAGTLPAFPVAGLTDIAARLDAMGHPYRWEQATPYLRQLVTTDPGGVSVALIPA